MKLSIIIPVYNEERTLAESLKRIEEIDIPGVLKQIIIVDDGSTDKSKQIIDKFKLNSGAKVFSHKKNSGKGAAVRTGIEYATGDYILIQDADLEYHPKFIKKLIEPIKNGKAKIVYGSRLRRMPNFSRDEKNLHFFLHYLGNKFLSLVTSLLYGQWITDMETCYKIFPKKAVKEINLRSKGFDFEPEITTKLLKKGNKILEVSITTTPRGYDQGKKLNTIKDGFIALWTILRYRFTD